MAKMNNAKFLNISQLCLDLENYRTMHQKDETSAINSMISIKPDRFWALMDSLIEDGYMGTENIILMESNGKFIVKEGNRRIAALKIIHGLIKGINIPRSTESRINELSDEWKTQNNTVPCLIYKSNNDDVVKKIISRIHAKGEKAGRDGWTTVARARYNRDEKEMTENGLDLLEKYIQHGKNLSDEQAERWSGDYPLTVLDEAIHKVFTHLKYDSTRKLVESYPQKNKVLLEEIMYDIGLEILDFKKIRDKITFFGQKYGIEEIVLPDKKTGVDSNQSSQSGNQGQPRNVYPPTEDERSKATNSHTDEPENKNPQKAKPKSVSLNDQKSVSRMLKTFTIRGNNRGKVSALHLELKKLKIETHPHAFCFLLRSMFEISAKVFCEEHKISTKNKKGCDKVLAEILSDVTKYLTDNKTDKDKTKQLHGAITEITKSDGLLSVTSMNQLVHNPKFSISPIDICILFSNIFPLLEELNR